MDWQRGMYIDFECLLVSTHLILLVEKMEIIVNSQKQTFLAWNPLPVCEVYHPLGWLESSVSV